ncbi:MAG: gamma carbonic anhydrase family protein [Planctomycetota bacterium]|nr:gamma carbonic anhydrase family protein [Planctomycetota bacterium]MDG2142952.1 gamma carbonic anhydrase family protein [Planctomycetota bacterium]
MATFPTHGLFRLLDGGAAMADNARITGEVELGKDTTIWFGVVIRGDDALVKIGKRTNVQDLTMVHADPGVPNVIGDDVTIGHGCVLHGKSVGDGSLIGMGAILLGGSVVGKQCIVAAGAVVRENFVVPDGSLVAGVPAKVLRPVSEEEKKQLEHSAEGYVKKLSLYLHTGK